MVPWPEIITICAPGCLQPVETRHLHIEEHEVGNELRIRADRLVAGTHRAHLDALELEELAHGFPHARLVVHDQHSSRHHSVRR
jgi:hypothetical protein